MRMEVQKGWCFVVNIARRIASSAWSFLLAIVPFVVAIAALAGVAILIGYLIENPTNNLSLTIGIVIVLAVSVLVLLLFLIALGFHLIRLDNPNEALGLPPGSVRALIALLLIIIWVIASIFLFTGISQQTITTTTITGASTTILTPSPGTDTLTPTTATPSIATTPTPATSGGTATITVSSGASDAIKLGTQFYTTMSTLVVAIAAFYFGSSTFRSGANSAGGGPQPPTVSSLSQTNGPAAGGTSTTITGSGFTGAKAVLFGSTNASSFTFNSDTQIVAVSPPGTATSTVDVTVTTSNGTSATSSVDQFTYT